MNLRFHNPNLVAVVSKLQCFNQTQADELLESVSLTEAEALGVLRLVPSQSGK